MKHPDRDKQANTRLARLMAHLNLSPVPRRFWQWSVPLTGILAWIVLHTPYSEGLTFGALWALFLGAALLGRLSWGGPLHRVALVGLVGLVAMRLFIEGVVNILSAL